MQKIIEVLSENFSKNHGRIADFFARKFAENPPLFYNSTDLRHSGFKIAPIDTNCFPAGFNNLSELSKEKSKIILKEFFAKNFPQAKKILIAPENHTENLRYLKNVLVLQEILSENHEVIIGSLIENLSEKMVINLGDNNSITLHSLTKKSDKIFTQNGFSPDLIILNNDLTNGIPKILESLSTPIIPSPNIGWHKRMKSEHFTIYNKLAEELAELINIDPWLISSMHRSCDEVNFKEQKGIKCLANFVDELIENLREKYKKYNIDEEPYCYIKADNGTYGIAVWPVFSGEDVLHINKKERNKMNMLKGAVQTTKVMIQEGIKTIDKIDGKIAEPMIYLINGLVVGNLFRVNENRDEKISLNSPGASFFDLENLSENQIALGANKNNISEIYSVISRLAALASSVENRNLN